MLCVENIRPTSPPFLGQPVGVPPVVIRNSSEQGDRKWVEVESFKNGVDRTGPFVAVVDAIEGVAGSIHRQRGDVETFAIWGNDGDTGGDAETNVTNLTQFLYHSIYLPAICSSWIEN